MDCSLIWTFLWFIFSLLLDIIFTVDLNLTVNWLVTGLVVVSDNQVDHTAGSDGDDVMLNVWVHILMSEVIVTLLID